MQNFDDKIAALLDVLPCDCYHKAEFSHEGGLWRFEFNCNSLHGLFHASEVRKDQAEAFHAAELQILDQVDQWHESRFTKRGESLMASFTNPTDPRILVIDDDEDLALAMYTAFEKLGCQADVAVKHEGLHRKLTDGTIDYIILDWNLNNGVQADRVFEKAIRLIETFSDLREKFNGHRPRIVTCSVLERDEIKLPAEGMKYFEHLDHWQKPVPYLEMIERADQLMKLYRGEGPWANGI
jgi:CheY-like chemotaxis protein